MCECIERLTKSLNEKYIDAKIETVEGINLETGETIDYAGYLKYFYFGLKNNGIKKNKKSTGCIVFNYCPMCGELYKYIGNQLEGL